MKREEVFKKIHSLPMDLSNKMILAHAEQGINLILRSKVREDGEIEVEHFFEEIKDEDFKKENAEVLINKMIGISRKIYARYR